MNALTPEPSLLAKLGSIVVHVDEGLTNTGHAFDWEAAKTLIGDPEVTEWIEHMQRLAMIPVKR